MIEVDVVTKRMFSHKNLLFSNAINNLVFPEIIAGCRACSLAGSISGKSSLTGKHI
jgi:hypothetical protein